jgi:hypothetical protein
MAKKTTRSASVITGKPASFGSALDECGFKPLGRRVKVKVGLNRSPLRTPSKPKAAVEQPE